MYLSDPKLDVLHVTVYLIMLNSYGHNANNVCYSFDFSRKIFNMINWQRFNFINLAKVSTNFQTSDLCTTVTENTFLFSQNKKEIIMR